MGDLMFLYGKQAYQAQQYAAALDFFQTVCLPLCLLGLSVTNIFQFLSQEKTPSIPALDARAATYEKLGNLEAALNDGRQLIRQFKTSCTVQSIAVLPIDQV